MTVAERVRDAVRQLRNGESIGRRGTPVVSYWGMRPKWEKWGNAWSHSGTDGDSIVAGPVLTIPARLSLTYLKCHDGRVCQLVSVVGDEVSGIPPTAELDNAGHEYDAARFSIPTRITD